jgi:sugar phosphate isomerase/epimerase
MSEKRSARDLCPQDLVMDHFTLARHHPIEDRVVAAGAAGYAGIGLLIENYRTLLASGLTDGYLSDLLDEHDVCLASIEVLRGWARGGDFSEADAQDESLAWRLADRFSARYVQAIGPFTGTPAEAGMAFGALCDRAAEHGLVVGLEFLPFTNIVTAADAMEIIERADRPNGGICLDIWHHERGANDFAMLEAIPGDRIYCIQMNDGVATPVLADYKQDCLHHRLIPGEGTFDLARFIELMRRKHVTAPWDLEVCNASTWGQPGFKHASDCAAALRHLLSSPSD